MIPPLPEPRLPAPQPRPVNRATHLESASAHDRLKGHMSHMRAVGRSMLQLANQGRLLDEPERDAAGHAVTRFLRELDNRMEVLLAQATDAPQVNKVAFAAFVREATFTYQRAITDESDRLLKLRDRKGGV